MLFNSVPFLIFFPIVVAAYFIVPFRARWLLLLAASYYFYMQWEPSYAILIVISTSLDYLATMMMRNKASKAERRPWLFVSLAGNLGMLFFFKYYNWFNQNLIDVTGHDLLPFSNLLLPVGISFYTFQSLSYTIDVYRGRLEAETHPGVFALYVALLPAAGGRPDRACQESPPAAQERAPLRLQERNRRPQADGCGACSRRSVWRTAWRPSPRRSFTAIRTRSPDRS